MAVSWSFAMLLVLTVVALVTFSQPLFQSKPAAVVRHTPDDLKLAPQAAIGYGAVSRHNILPTSKGEKRTEFGRQGRLWTRKLIQRDVSPPCDSQQLSQVGVICTGKRKTSMMHKSGDRDTIPRRSVSAHFESDRMVPSGPNPLHNSNRSQVIFP